MTVKTTQLRDAIVIALATGATAMLTAGTASAQQPVATTGDSQATTLDRVQVTGSRIRQVDVETAQPVLTISRQDIERQGFQSVADILQNISAVGTPPISRASPLSAGEAAGGTFISLRNLGAARTLVLMNGRRLGITTSGLADISQVPASAVERIEVLKDGASSIYGSDAIAGVINIITRSNYEGAQVSAYYGQYGEGDGGVTRADGVMGFTGDRGSLTVAAEWVKEDVVKAADRPYSAFPRSSYHPTDNWTSVGFNGGFVTTATTPIPGVATGTRVVLRDGGNPLNRADYIAQDTFTGTCVGATATTGCTPGSTVHKANTNLQTDLRTPLERTSLYVDGVFDITDAVRFRTNLLYNNRVSDRTVAGYPMQAASFATPMSPLSYFNPTATIDPATGRNFGFAVVPPGEFPTVQFIPTGGTIANWWRRTWEVPRVTSADLTTYRFSAAFEGSFDALDRTFDWDVSYLNNTNKLVQNSYGNLNLANLRNAVGPSFLENGTVICGTPDNPATAANERNVITGCVPFNPFIPFGVAGAGSLSGNQALQNYLFQEEHSTGRTETTVMAANLAGSIFALPAGDLGFAVGVENRKEEGAFSPDALAQTAGSTNLASGPTGGSYKVDEVYLELEIPLLSDLPFARELTLNAASRFSSFDTFGETTNNKFSLKWKPFDSLLLRGTVADGFRAPTINDLYGGTSDTFSFYTDPCDTVFGSAASNPTTAANCASGVGGFGAIPGGAAGFRQRGQGFTPVGAPLQQTPVAFRSGSNPTLTPELSRSQTIGGVWSPSFIEGLNVALDWWKVRIADTIVADTPQQILNDCYINGIANRCSPALFTRDAALGYVNSLSFGGANAGYRKVEGFDFDIGYRFATENMGNFTFASNSSYTAKDYFVATNDPRFPTSGVSFNSQFRVRSNFNAGWQMGSFGVNWMARYYSKMKEACAYLVPGSTEPNLECNEIVIAPTGTYVGVSTTPASSISRRRVVGSNTFHDLQVRWEAPWDATIAIGANNVFNHVGPVMYTQPSANVSYYGGFDIGRFTYLRYTQRF